MTQQKRYSKRFLMSFVLLLALGFAKPVKATSFSERLRKVPGVTALAECWSNSSMRGKVALVAGGTLLIAATVWGGLVFCRVLNKQWKDSGEVFHYDSNNSLGDRVMNSKPARALYSLKKTVLFAGFGTFNLGTADKKTKIG